MNADLTRKQISATIAPLPDFDWLGIAWRAPEEAPGDDCSCCGGSLAADPAPPLEIRTSDGWRARFCASCVGRWWRIEFDPAAPPAADR